jgi:Mg-chelatase subunit ChlD
MTGGARRRRRCTSSVLASLILLAGSASSGLLRAVDAHAVAKSVSNPHTATDLIRLFNVEGVPADFVVVVDTSGSMSTQPPGHPPYPHVRTAYAQLVHALGPGDQLSLVTFSNVPTVDFQGPVASAKQKSQALKALPSKADGPATDIGAALNQTLNRLDRVNASDVQIVLFLTDGKQNAPVGSPYARVGDAAWKSLQRRGRSIASQHAIEAYGVGLGQGSSTDVGLLQGVFPNPTIVALPPDQLGPFFKEAVLQSELLRLRQPLHQELQSGTVTATVLTPPGLARHVSLSVRLSSTFRHLPVDVHLRQVAVRDGGRVVPASVLGGLHSFRLAPGSHRIVTVAATLPVSSPGLQIPQKHEVQSVRLDLEGSLTAQPSSLIHRLFKFDTTSTLTSPSASNLRRTVGYSLLEAIAAVLAALLLILAIGAFLRWLFVPPPLVGFFEPAGDSTSHKAVRLSGRRMVIDHKRLPDAGGAAIEVFTRPRHRNTVYAVSKRPEVQVRERHNRWRTITGECLLSGGEHYRIGGAHVVWWRTKED